MRIAILLVALVLGSEVAGGQKYSGPTCLGPYCIDRDTPVGQLLRRLGPRPRRGSQFLPYCYESENRRIFLYVRSTPDVHATVDGVLLGDFPICLHMAIAVTKDDLDGWKTSEGIGLGSTEEDVLRTYGRPLREDKADSKLYKQLIPAYREGDKPDAGDKALEYYANPDVGDLSLAEFGIRNGKVSFIWLSYSE